MDEKLENFDDARNAAEEMFNGEQESLEDVPETPADEVPEEEPAEQEAAQEPDPMQVTETAVQTAEAAAQAAAQKDAQLQQVMQELSALKEQNNNLQQTIQQMGQQQEETLVNEAMGPPELDLNSLMYADPEYVRQKQAEYAQQMAEYIQGGVMKDIEPFVSQAKEGLAEKERREALSALSNVPQLEGIQDLMPHIETIIANNPALFSEDVPIDDKYITAYAMAKGIDSINNPPKDPTAEELMKYYQNNQEFQDLIEKQRLQQVKGSQQVPPLSASSGAVNAALNIKNKPNNLEEASELTRKLFSGQ